MSRLFKAGSVLSLLGALVLLGACGDEDTKAAATPDPSGGPDGGVTAAAPIPLTAWVDLMIDQTENEAATPDTVEDKNIANVEEPTAFDKYFPQSP